MNKIYLMPILAEAIKQKRLEREKLLDECPEPIIKELCGPFGRVVQS